MRCVASACGLLAVTARRTPRERVCHNGDRVAYSHVNLFVEAEQSREHYAMSSPLFCSGLFQYGDVVSELLADGFNVYAMDWRSQGLSGRLLLDPQVRCRCGFVFPSQDFVSVLLECTSRWSGVGSRVPWLHMYLVHFLPSLNGMIPFIPLNRGWR